VKPGTKKGICVHQGSYVSTCNPGSVWGVWATAEAERKNVRLCALKSCMVAGSVANRVTEHNPKRAMSYAWGRHAAVGSQPAMLVKHHKLMCAGKELTCPMRCSANSQ